MADVPRIRRRRWAWWVLATPLGFSLAAFLAWTSPSCSAPGTLPPPEAPQGPPTPTSTATASVQRLTLSNGWQILLRVTVSEYYGEAPPCPWGNDTGTAARLEWQESLLLGPGQEALLPHEFEAHPWPPSPAHYKIMSTTEFGYDAWCSVEAAGPQALERKGWRVEMGPYLPAALLPVLPATGGLRQVHLDEPFALNAFEAVEVAEGPFVLWFKIRNDFRCPRDVSCPSAGEAGLEAKFSKRDGRSETRWPITYPGQESMVPRGTWGDFAIVLSDLLPDRLSETAIAPTDYRLTARVRAAAGVP